MQGSRIQTGVLAWTMPHTREEISGPHMGSMLARYWLVHVRYSPCSPYCWSPYLSLAWLSCLPFSLLIVSSPQSLMHSVPFSLSPSRHHIIHISILSSFTVSFLFICLRYNIYISWVVEQQFIIKFSISLSPLVTFVHNEHWESLLSLPPRQFQKAKNGAVAWGV